VGRGGGPRAASPATARRKALPCLLARTDPRSQTEPVNRVFADGELIVLVDKVGRRHKLRLRAGEKHSIHSGLIQHDDLIGRPEGVVVTTQLGARLLAVRPTFAEQVKRPFLPGGILFAHCRNGPQLHRLLAGLGEVGGFGMLEPFEPLQGGWTVGGAACGPRTGWSPTRASCALPVVWRRTTSSNPKARASGNPSRGPGVSSAWGDAS